MSVMDELLRANIEYAKTFDLGDLPTPPARRRARTMEPPMEPTSRRLS